MGGIAGWIDYAKNNTKEKKIIENMQMALTHCLEKKSVFLSQEAIFVESIAVDKYASLFSIGAKGETFTIVYSGNLYNCRQIKKELSKKTQFESDKESEILLRAYVEWGEDCVCKFNGTFAFAVWHHNSKSLFLAVDRAGVKSLYYYRTRKGLIFASEIKALLQNPAVRKEVDSNGLQQILLLGPARVVGSGCIRGVSKLKPGERLCFDRQGLKVSTYWRLAAMPHQDDYEKTKEKSRQLIEDAIILQLDATNLSACFLSGGLDSSIISKIVADEYKKNNTKLTTYSVDYKDNDKYFEKNSYQPDSDNKYIQIMSNAIGSNHISIELDNLEVAKSIEEAAIARGYPGMGDIDSSLLQFCRYVSRKHSICLSGECADEIFGGYPWYHREELLYNESFPWSDSLELRKKLFKTSYAGTNAKEFVNNAYKNIISYTDYLDNDSKKDRRIREMFMLNYFYFMQTLLERSEQMSAYANLEIRVPFADYRLVEYAFNMPWEYKSKKGREKGIMRDAFNDILPKAIIDRKKSPYPKTFNPLLVEYVKQQASKLVNSKESVLNEIINKDFFEKLLSGEYTAAVPWFGQLMREPQVFAYLIQIDTFFKELELSIV